MNSGLSEFRAGTRGRTFQARENRRAMALRQHSAWQVLENAQGPCDWSGGSRKEEERSHRELGPDPAGNCSSKLLPFKLTYLYNANIYKARPWRGGFYCICFNTLASTAGFALLPPFLVVRMLICLNPFSSTSLKISHLVLAAKKGDQLIHLNRADSGGHAHGSRSL